MTYDDLARFFERRRNGAPYKEFSNYVHLWREDNGAFVIGLAYSKYDSKHERVGGKYGFLFPKHLLCRVTSDDQLTVLSTMLYTGNTIKKVLGVWGSPLRYDKKGHPRHKFAARYILAGVDVPWTEGLVIDLRSRKPVRHAQDYVSKVNRQRCKLFKPHIDKVMAVMDTLVTIEELGPEIEAKWPLSWACSDAFITDQASCAFNQGRPWMSWASHSWDNGTRTSRELSWPEQVQLNYYEKRRARALKFLTEHVRRYNNGYDVTPVPSPYTTFELELKELATWPT